MKISFLISVTLIIYIGLLAGCMSPVPEPAPETSIQENASINAEIIRMQQEIIKLRQRILRDTEIKMESGQVDLLDLIDARANLAEANINLAKSQGRDDLVLEELQKLVQFYINTKDKLVAELDSGTRLARDVYELEIALMEANIRLSKTLLEIRSQLSP